MAPTNCQAPTGKAENIDTNSSSSAKKNSRRHRRKAIPLDPMSLTFLTTRCQHGILENEKSLSLNTFHNFDFFTAVLESVKPAVFFALDSRVKISI